MPPLLFSILLLFSSVPENNSGGTLENEQLVLIHLRLGYFKKVMDINLNVKCELKGFRWTISWLTTSFHSVCSWLVSPGPHVLLVDTIRQLVHVLDDLVGAHPQEVTDRGEHPARHLAERVSRPAQIL